MKSFIWAIIFLAIVTTGVFLAEAFPPLTFIIGFATGNLSLIAAINSVEEMK